MRRILLLLGLVVLLVACSHGEESECSKYVVLLAGDNPRTVFESVSEQKCQDAVPALKKLFDPRQGQYNKEILRILSDIWDPSAASFKSEAEKFPKRKVEYVEVLRLALQSPETAALAASLADEWKLVDLRADLRTMLETDIQSAQPQFMAAYGPTITALSSDRMGGFDEELEGVYITLLSNSSDVQGIAVNKIAATALGVLKSSNPEAVKALIRGLFMVSKAGGTVFKESLNSLLAIGGPSVPALVDILKTLPGDEKVRYMEEFAVKNAISDWKWRKGMRIPMLLAQLRNEQAAAALIYDIGQPVIEPANLPDNLKLDWTIAQTNRIKFDSWGLMSVFHPGVALEALRTMRNRNVEGSARLQLALALAFAFTPESRDTLFRVVWEPEIFEDELTEEEEAALEAQRKKENLPAVANESDFVIRFLQTVAYATDYPALVKFNDVFVDGFDENFGDVERAEDIQEKLEQIDIKVLLKVPAACKRDLDCYINVLNGSIGKMEGNKVVYNPDEVEGIDAGETAYVQAMGRCKAGLVLGRWVGKRETRRKVVDALIRVYKGTDYDDELYGDLRQVILLGLERQGRKDRKYVSKALEDLLEVEGKKGIGAVKVWNQRLTALKFYVDSYRAPEKAKVPAKAEKKAEKKAE